MTFQTVPYGGKAQERATLLLAAAADLDLDPRVVETTGDGSFRAPAEVVEKAGLSDEVPVEEDEVRTANSDEAEESTATDKPKRGGRRAKNTTKE